MLKLKIKPYNNLLKNLVKHITKFIIIIFIFFVFIKIVDNGNLNTKQIKINNKYDTYFPLLGYYTELIKNNTVDGMKKLESDFQNKDKLVERGIYEGVISYYYGRIANYTLQKEYSIRSLDLLRKDEEAIKILMKVYAYTITNAINNRDYAFALEYIYRSLEDLNSENFGLIDSEFIKDFNVRLQCNTIIMFVNNNLVDRADEYYNALVKLDINSEAYKNNKSNIIYCKILYHDARGDYKELLDASYAYYDNAIENGSTNLEGLRLNIGKALIANGKIDEGLKELEIARKFYTTNGGDVEKGEVLFAYGIYYEAIRDYEKSFKMYEDAYNIFDKNIDDKVKTTEIIKKIYSVNKKLGYIKDITKYNDEYYKYTSDNKENKTVQLLKAMDEINGRYYDIKLDLKHYEEIAMKKANSLKGIIIILLLFALSILIVVLDYLKSKIQENTIYENRLKDMIDKDNLSKCLSRVKGISIIEGLMNNKKNLVLGIIDIDNFKKINDVYGHICGDNTIATFGEILLEFKDDNIYPIRYGGEEFIIAYNGSDEETIVKYLEKLRDDLKNSKIIEGVSITFSAGVCKWNGESIEELINNADKKLYEAKKTGKNRIVI